MKFGTSVLRGLIFGGLTFGGNFVLVRRGLAFRGTYIRGLGRAYIRYFTVFLEKWKKY